MKMRPTRFGILLLLFIQYVASIIVPDEIFDVISTAYSQIPAVKKGTDSRLGVGFRFGEHADFQIIMELGPQYETKPLTHPLSKEESKRKRDAIMNSALKGELGPWAQTIAERKMERKLKSLLNRQKLSTEKWLKVDSTSSKKEDNRVGIESYSFDSHLSRAVD